MSTVRSIPFIYITGISFLGGASSTFFRSHLPVAGVSSAKLATGVFGALFSLQLFSFLFYAIFIYPFYISPFRHLPSPKGGWPLIGHGRSLRQYGPGHMARQWYFSFIFALTLLRQNTNLGVQKVR